MRVFIAHASDLKSSLLSHRFPIQFLSTLRSVRSLPHHKIKPDNWNTNHSFVQSNPLLALLEKSTSINHLLQIQSQMTVTRLVSDPLALSRLIAFCAVGEFRDLGYCKKLVMCSGVNVNVFSWNVMIRGYLESNLFEDVVWLYKLMLREERRADNYTFPLLFKACDEVGWVWTGEGVVGHVVKLGFECDVFVFNAMLFMFMCCGRLGDARKVFDGSSVRDLVSWNSLINGYVRGGKGGEALGVYWDMVEEGEVEADEVTMVGVVSACAQLADLKLGSYFHSYVKDKGLKLTVPLSNVLMDMYVKCGELKEARTLFDRMEKKTVVSWTTIVAGYAKFGFFDTSRQLLDVMPEKDSAAPWNAMISGYVQAKRSKEALALFHEMQSCNVWPDEVTMVSCLSACSQLGALDVGIWIHRFIERNKLSLNVALGTALIDMYAKCGNIIKAIEVFSQVPTKNSLTWTALICGLALHGKSFDAISYFSKMINAGSKPDEVTFIGLLTACCHGGLVNEGRRLFSQMTKVYRLSPKVKHYSCMVDLLGKAGLLEEAEKLIDTMPMAADAVVWAALFSACRMHKNTILGEKAGFKLLELDPHDSATYVMLAYMYSEANMWEQAGKVRKMMKERGVEKTPGCSSIEVNGNVFEFIVRDKAHSESQDIYNCLVQLTTQLRPVEHTLRFLDTWESK